ncbi:hypothetical protein HYQ46_000183 [Verticillium longisporum]|nr:hypothetical protein HYQ46_000183 [Verticillium longisporum]
MVSVARHLCLHRLMNMSRRRTPRKPTIATLTTSRHPHISVPASARSSHGQNPLFSLTRRMRSQIPNSCKLSASFESVRQALEFKAHHRLPPNIASLGPTVQAAASCHLQTSLDMRDVL